MMMSNRISIGISDIWLPLLHKRRYAVCACVHAHTQCKNIKIDLHMWPAISIVNRQSSPICIPPPVTKVSVYTMGYFLWNQVNFVLCFFSFDFRKMRIKFYLLHINSICYMTWKNSLDEDKVNNNDDNDDYTHSTFEKRIAEKISYNLLFFLYFSTTFKYYNTILENEKEHYIQSEMSIKNGNVFRVFVRSFVRWLSVWLLSYSLRFSSVDYFLFSNSCQFTIDSIPFHLHSFFLTELCLMSVDVSVFVCISFISSCNPLSYFQPRTVYVCICVQYCVQPLRFFTAR